ncbi:expressed protein [Phakopsora pachyrhizi]|uniref:Expressed protein n=1 Tax=Phakopsora pachyrhizi TaxID=170000 RepID=A0A0S1MJT1_PHAPC|nr:expressed protein [Phakopsora pachyrhizi]
MLRLISLGLLVCSAARLTVSSPSDLSLRPRQLGLGAGGAAAGSFSSSTSVSTFSSFVQGWSVIPTAFGTCAATFQQRVTVQVAVQSVQQLYSTVNGVLGHYGGCGGCGGASAAGAYASKFQSIITQSFTSWQTILQVGQSSYANAWDSQFIPLFRQFNPFLTAVQQNSGLFGINLGNLLGGLHLNINLFSSCGLNVGGLLGGVLNVVGGLLGGH